MGPCYNHPLLRGSSWQQAGRKEAWAVHALPPGPAVWRLALTGPYSPLQRHTKTSLSIMGVQHQREGKTERAKEVRQEGGGAEKWRGEEGRAMHPGSPSLPHGNGKGIAELQGHILSRHKFHHQCTTDRAGSSFRYPCSPGSIEPEFTLQQLFSTQGTSSRLMNKQEGRPSIANRQTIQGTSPAGSVLAGLGGERVDWELIRFPWKAKPDSSSQEPRNNPKDLKRS